ncbi:cathepsin L1-like [Colossoma macropomum]|uniref:cathepsin L1-like n=1 Tax=Colossoma macropomum TaxID=42526 RepID=UPI0018644253|nr:cathepsin L1-like [Colossoma macropomum]
MVMFWTDTRRVHWMELFSRMVLLGLFVSAPIRAATESEEESPTDWTLWKKANGVMYKVEADDKERRVIWETNKRMIDDNNKKFQMGMSSFTMTMNKYGDWTKAEYKRLQGAKINSKVKRKGMVASANALRNYAKRLRASTLDYRTMGYVTEVKDQGYCGSCWAFSTTGAIEAQMFKHTGQLVSLSEQHLVDCSRSYGTYGCSGAWMANAYDFVIGKGLQANSTYPYTALDTQPCFYEPSQVVAHISDYRFIPNGNEQVLADALAVVGPITVAIDADHPSFMFYSSGIYVNPKCSSSNLNHAVLLVGYGSKGGKDYWLIKNSWGTSWGEGGYMRMIRNGKNTCGIASYALYPIV